MRTIRRLIGLPLLALLVVAACAANGRAGLIHGVGGTGRLGDFDGRIEYATADATHATLTVELWNTSPAGNGGYLTAFAFNVPSDRISGASLATTNQNFQLLGGASSHGGIHAPPYGSFDLGASTSDKFLGGGSPQGGIAVGESAVFTFVLSGNGLNELTEENFLGARSAAAEGGAEHVDFVARFRGFLNGGSDKVPGIPGGHDRPPSGDIPTVPEPGALTLAAIAVLGAFGFARRKRAATSR